MGRDTVTAGDLCAREDIASARNEKRPAREASQAKSAAFASKFERQKNAYETSQAYDRLSQHLMSLVEAFRRSTRANVCAHTEPARGGNTITFLTGLKAIVQIRCQCADTLDAAFLEARILSHLPSGQYRRERQEPEQLASHRFRCVCLEGEVEGWISAGSEARFFSTAQLATHLLEEYVEHWLRETSPDSAVDAGDAAPRRPARHDRIKAAK